MGRKGRKEKGKKGRKSRGGRKERRQARNLDTDFIFMGFTFPPSSVKRHINRKLQYTIQFISVDQLCPWIAARQDSLSIINPQSSLKLMSIELVMPSSHLVLCHHLLFLPSIYPSIRVFSKESVLIRWPKYWSSASASVLPMNIQD